MSLFPEGVKLSSCYTTTTMVEQVEAIAMQAVHDKEWVDITVRSVHVQA